MNLKPDSTAVVEQIRVESDAEDSPNRLLCDGGVRMPIEELDIEAELALKERGIDEAPIGITITDPDRPDNPMIYINDAFERLTGYDKESALGRNCRFLQGPDTNEATVAKMRGAIDAGESVSAELINYRKDGEPFWNRVDIAPVHDANGELTNFVGFQTDVTDRKKAETRARQERENLEHLLSRIEGLIQDVTRGLVEAGSRPGVETAVCERITAVESYQFAWIATPDLSNETLVETASAGEWDSPADEIVRDIDGPSSDPTVRAYESGELAIVDDPATLSTTAPGGTWLNTETLDGIAGIPLVYDGTVYGVLTVYTTERTTLTNHETVVLEALGRATGTAINALERGRLLATDSVTELDLQMSDDSLFFVDLSARTGCTLEYGGSIYREDGSMLLFFTTDLYHGTLNEAVASIPTVDAVTPLQEYEETMLCEFTVTEASLVATLAERGVRIRSMAVRDGLADLSIEIPKEEDARTIVEFLREQFPETELTGRRELDTPPDTRRGFLSALEDRLTERQLTTLQKAYLSGYYDRDRSITGTELAASMDLDRSTFHQHLRAAERKLVEAFFER